ncbi:MAG: cellulase family glycosylhydrolase [Gilvibacter sp.]
MKRIANKRLFLISLWTVCLLAILFGISQVLSYLNSGATRSDMLHLDLKKENYYTPAVKWQDVSSQGRPFLEQDIKQIKEDYLRAWYIRNQALKQNLSKGLEDAFTQEALINLKELISQHNSLGQSIEFTTLSHNITPIFFSDDGKIVSFIDQDVTFYNRVLQNEIPIAQSHDTASYKVIMFFEEGVWRIRHFNQIESNPQGDSTHLAQSKTELLNGINYYPKDQPWDTFGSDFNPIEIAQDFKKIKSLGLNSIRIFIGYEDFGASVLDTIKTDKLVQLMDLAYDNDLKVVVTLFDFYGNYAVSDWSLTMQHLRGIVAVLKTHKALHSWDIKNEPDLDFDSRGRDVISAWLEQCKRTINQLDTQHPVTIGWSSIEAAMAFTQQVDYVSFHYYDDIELLAQKIALLERTTDLDWVLQEIGSPSQRGFWSPFGSSQKGQAQFYESMFDQLGTTDKSFFIWTLYDFEQVPSSVAGWRPWRKNKQANFGLFDVHNNLKESGTVVKARMLNSN